jgi:hypothetical protein
MLMSSRHLIGVLSFVFVGVARPVAAQACLGRPAAASAPAHVGASYLAYRGANSQYGVELGALSQAGTFGTAAFAMTSNADGIGRTKTADLWLGQAISTHFLPIAICPMGGLEYVALPSFDNFGGGTIAQHQLVTSVGVSIGVPLDVSPSIQIVPFGETYFQRREFRASGPVVSTTGFGRNGLYEIGVMVVANHRLAIGPVTRNVFGVSGIADAGRPAYGVVASFNFGR